MIGTLVISMLPFFPSVFLGIVTRMLCLAQVLAHGWACNGLLPMRLGRFSMLLQALEVAVGNLKIPIGFQQHLVDLS
jgi:hypothetical protein